MSKYAKLDKRVFAWLKKHRTGISTARLYKALRITDVVTQRHISRRFTQLEDKGVLVCKLQRTMRVCVLVEDPPKTLSKKRWKPQPPPPAPKPAPSIPAENSLEFEMAGGKIERLPTHWDKPRPQTPLGTFTLIDTINNLD